MIDSKLQLSNFQEDPICVSVNEFNMCMKFIE